MRQAIICTMMFLVTSGLFSQQSNSQPSFTQQDYLEKSKKHRLAGSILLIGGAGLMATAIIIPRGELIDDGIWPGWFVKYKNDGIKGDFIIAGTLTALSSIPLFILDGKNRRKAASVSFKKENTVLLNNQNPVYSWVPALRVKVDF